MDRNTFDRRLIAPLVLGATLACAGTAHAQVPLTTPAPTAAPAAQPQTPVTAEQRTAIKELFDAMNTRDQLGKAFGAMAQGLPPQMAQAMNQQIENNATLTPEQKTKVRQGMDAPFAAALKEAQGIMTNPKLVDETMDRMYAVYARSFTLPEVRQLITFYKSPIGVKSLNSMPQAINESLQAGVSIFQPRLAAVMDRTLKTQIDAATKK